MGTPITLEQLKQRVFDIYQGHTHQMRDWIEYPVTLKYSGYKDLETALKQTVLHIEKEVEKLNQKYERENPA